MKAMELTEKHRSLYISKNRKHIIPFFLFLIRGKRGIKAKRVRGREKASGPGTKV